MAYGVYTKTIQKLLDEVNMTKGLDLEIDPAWNCPILDAMTVSIGYKNSPQNRPTLNHELGRSIRSVGSSNYRMAECVSPPRPRRRSFRQLNSSGVMATRSGTSLWTFIDPGNCLIAPTMLQCGRIQYGCTGGHQRKIVL